MRKAKNDYDYNLIFNWAEQKRDANERAQATLEKVLTYFLIALLLACLAMAAFNNDSQIERAADIDYRAEAV